MFQLPLLCQNYFLCSSKDVEDHQIFYEEHMHTEQGQRFIFVIFQHFVNIIIFRGIFSGSLLFSGVALLNWFAKSYKFLVGFNNNELFWALFSPFHCKILLSVVVQQAKKFLSHDNKLKGNILLQHSMQYQYSLQFWRYL